MNLNSTKMCSVTFWNTEPILHTKRVYVTIPTFFVVSDVKVAINVRTDEAVTFMTMSDTNISTWWFVLCGAVLWTSMSTGNSSCRQHSRKPPLTSTRIYVSVPSFCRLKSRHACPCNDFPLLRCIKNCLRYYYYYYYYLLATCMCLCPA